MNFNFFNIGYLLKWCFGQIRLNKICVLKLISPVSFAVFNTRQFKITYVAHIVFKLDSAALDRLSQCQLLRVIL